MNRDAFGKLFWGFLFIMFDFRLQGFDVLPDIVGYILFAIGFGILLENSRYFRKAKNFNYPLILLSLFQIYEPPIQNQGGINFGPLGPLGVLIGIGTLVLTLIVVYNIFLGIKDMAEQSNLDEIYLEADKRWKQFIYLHIAIFGLILVIFIPLINIMYVMGVFVATIVIMISIMKFMKKCGEDF